MASRCRDCVYTEASCGTCVQCGQAHGAPDDTSPDSTPTLPMTAITLHDEAVRLDTCTQTLRRVARDVAESCTHYANNPKQRHAIAIAMLCEAVVLEALLLADGDIGLARERLLGNIEGRYDLIIAKAVAGQPMGDA